MVLLGLSAEGLAKVDKAGTDLRNEDVPAVGKAGYTLATPYIPLASTSRDLRATISASPG